MIFCNGIGVSTASFWQASAQALEKVYKLVHWDYRGHGLSDPPRDPETLDITRCAKDLAEVMDALDIPQAVVVGHSMGVQVSFEFYRLFPERVRGLVLVQGSFQRPFDTFMHFTHSAKIFKKISEMVIEYPKVARAVWPMFFPKGTANKVARMAGFVHPSLFPEVELEIYLSHMSKLSPLLFFHLARYMQKHSAEELLEEIDLPALIFAGEKDLFTPVELSVEMYQRMPKAELQLIRHGSHAAFVEQPELFWMRMLFFLHHKVADYGLSEEALALVTDRA